ncbi:MAG TPA: hypothetical protein VKC54_04270 [Patescibacteria group bacterium]|nr:hypothetical protein [Patescibacteria group bacterium]
MAPERKTDKNTEEIKKGNFMTHKRNYGEEDLDKIDPELFNVVEAPKTKSKLKVKIRDFTDEDRSVSPQ